MANIEVTRERPPAYGHCKAEGCGRLIEWVTTVASGKRMPVTAPLVVVESYTRQSDGRLVARIDGSQAHFNVCPGAERFRRTTAHRKKPVQGELFPGGDGA